MQGVTHEPRVVVAGDAGIGCGDGEGIATRQGSGGAGGGEREWVAAERVRIGAVGVDGARLQLLQLVQQVVCCLRRIDALETAVTAGTARASAARAGTALAGIIVAIVVVIASTATVCSRRPPQVFGTQQQPGRSCKIARLDGLLECCVLSRAELRQRCN